MAAPDAHEAFIEKWRERWPEWAIAETFVPPAQRELAVGWFALLQEFADAAWSGTDPAPGLAKLAWWQEELRGWAKGAHRHPLGALLQPLPAPWAALADALPVLRHRELPERPQQALEALQPLAQAAAAVEATLFSANRVPALAALSLLGAAAVHVSGAAAAAELLQASQAAPRSNARTLRLHGCLLQLRLQRAADDGRWQPAPRWRTLWSAWRAARN